LQELALAWCGRERSSGIAMAAEEADNGDHNHNFHKVKPALRVTLFFILVT